MCTHKNRSTICKSNNSTQYNTEKFIEVGNVVTTVIAAHGTNRLLKTCMQMCTVGVQMERYQIISKKMHTNLFLLQHMYLLFYTRHDVYMWQSSFVLLWTACFIVWMFPSVGLLRASIMLVITSLV